MPEASAEVYLVTAEEMRECDARTIRAGTPGLTLMGRAGHGIVADLRRRFRPLATRQIWIVCGRGNNGGDGLVVARRLHGLGLNPRVLLTDEAGAYAGDAAVQLDRVRRRRIVLERWDRHHFRQISRLEEDDILVDAILGTGFRGPLRGEKAEIIEAMNASRASIVAVDIPSGLSADTGEVAGTAILADRTVTMAYPKRAFLFWPARGHVGDWTVVDIGIPGEVAEAVAPVARLVTEEMLARSIPRFPRTAHKGTRGKLLIAGGSPGLTGAVCMAAAGALRTGAGLVRAVVPACLNPILEAKLTEAMTFPAPETGAGTLARETARLLLGLQHDWDALVLGPGLGRHPETDRLAVEVVERWRGPLLVDADGLNALAAAGIPRIGGRRPAPVFTPHPGEMARLSGEPVARIAADPVRAAHDFATRHRVVLLLKGSPTVVAGPDGTVRVSGAGSPALATGGTGDVLSGIIGTLLAQGIDPPEAAAYGACLHGLSAEGQASGLAERDLAAGEVADGLTAVWERLGRLA